MKEIANKTCDFNAGWLLMLGALCVKIGVSRTASLSLSPVDDRGFLKPSMSAFEAVPFW